MRSTYLRIWDPLHGPDGGCPDSNRIQQDINRIIDETYVRIFQNRGRGLSGPHNPRGRRRSEMGRKVNGTGPGGARTKIPHDSAKGKWMHPDAKEIYDETFEKYKL